MRSRFCGADRARSASISAISLSHPCHLISLYEYTHLHSLDVENMQLDARIVRTQRLHRCGGKRTGEQRRAPLGMWGVPAHGRRQGQAEVSLSTVVFVGCFPETFRHRLGSVGRCPLEWLLDCLVILVNGAASIHHI